jgi:hypothetical protein
MKKLLALLCLLSIASFGAVVGIVEDDIAIIPNGASTAQLAAETEARIDADDDLRQIITSGQALSYEFYISTNKYASGAFGYTPTNEQYEFCNAQTTNASSFTYTYTATNTYGYVAFCTNQVFYTNGAGTAYFYDYSSENGSGSITEKVELYAFEVGTTNSVEIGDVAIPLNVTAGTTPVMRLFNIPYIAYSSTNGYYFGIKKKCTAKGSGSTVTQWAGNGYNTHLDLALPSSVLADFYVAKSAITPTVTSDTDTIPSNLAVQQAISNATPSVSLQNVLNTGKTATNANMVIGSTNQTLGKVAIVGEAGAFTNAPLLYLERTATATGNLISGVVTGRVIGGIGLNGQLISTGSAGGTNYMATTSWDATNKVFIVTETVQ